MSYRRNPFVVAVLCALLAAMMVPSLSAKEGPRVWTNTDGKKVTGVMKDKGDDWVKIEVKGKVHKLKLTKLSEKDQEYVKGAKIWKPLVLKTEVLSRKASDLDFNVRTLKVDVKNIEEGKRLYCLVVWVSQLRTSGGVGVKSHVEDFYSEDGVYKYEASFSNNRKVGQAYRGFALRVVDEDGKVLLEKGSTSTYTRFLDTVFARQAPKPKRKKNENEKEK